MDQMDEYDGVLRQMSRVCLRHCRVPVCLYAILGEVENGKATLNGVSNKEHFESGIRAVWEDPYAVICFIADNQGGICGWVHEGGFNLSAEEIEEIKSNFRERSTVLGATP